MPTEAFKLPQASIDVLEKVIVGYANAGENVSRDDVAGIIGMHPNRVSENNAFLIETGLINKGNKKTATDLMKQLGRAIQFNHEEDIQNSYKQLVESTDFLAKLVTFVRINDDVNQDKLAERALYFSGQAPDNKGAKAGAKAVTEILLRSGLIKNNDGVLEVDTPTTDEKEMPLQREEEATDKTNGQHVSHAETVQVTPSGPSIPSREILGNHSPSININIELALPATEKAEIYENLFKAMRENLFPSNE